MAKNVRSQNAAQKILENIPTPKVTSDVKKTPEQLESKLSPTEQDKDVIQEEFTRASLYLPKSLLKAVKLKTIESDDPDHKTISSIVRAALKQYLQL